MLLVLMRILCPGDFLFARLFFLVFMDAIIIHGSLMVVEYVCVCGFCKRSSTNWAALALATLNLVSRSAAALPTRLRGCGSSPPSLFSYSVLKLLHLPKRAF